MSEAGLTFVEEVLVRVQRHLLRQAVEQNVRRLVAPAAQGRIAEQLVQGRRLALKTLEQKGEKPSAS